MAEIVLPVRGMHCAGCVGKVERALQSVEGVTQATVNLATERATVSYEPSRTAVEVLQQAVARAGYELVSPRQESEPADAPADEAITREREQRQLRIKFVVGALLSLPILAGSMPAVFPWAPDWLREPWLLLALTTPVMF